MKILMVKASNPSGHISSYLTNLWTLTFLILIQLYTYYIYRHIVNKEAIFLNFQHNFACNFLFLSYIQWLRALMHMKGCIKWRIWKGPVSIWIEYALDVGLI